MRRALAILIVVLLGCGPENVLEQGEVIGKDYDDPDSWHEFQCMAYDSDLNCMWWGYVDKHDGPHWFLTIVGRDDEGKQREERHEVTQTLHDLVQDGQTVNLSSQSTVPM